MQGEGALDGKTPLDLALVSKNGSILRHMIQCNSKLPGGVVLQASSLAAAVHRCLCV